MDFAELESVEGLRWTWNAWPSSAADLVIPLAVIHTPLAPLPDVPLLNYPPLRCTPCRAVINPYARVIHPSSVWLCPLCQARNPFPRSYAGLTETHLPAELFPTHSTVEYALSPPLTVPAFVFVVDSSSPPDEVKPLTAELLRVLAQLPDRCHVALVSFSSVVAVHDLSFADCARAVVLPGDRNLASGEVRRLLGVSDGRFLRRISDCEFRITTAVEELCSSSTAVSGGGRRPGRATGAAVSAAVALLESSSAVHGGRVMVFTSGPATIGPGKVAQIDLASPVRSHRDIAAGDAPLYPPARGFYAAVAERLAVKSAAIDLFACSLDQVGVAEMAAAVDASGGFLVLAESFSSEQFQNSLRRIFRRQEDNNGSGQLCMDATLDVTASREIKISSAIGPCASSGATWKLSSLGERTSVAFFFHVAGAGDQGPVFFLQFRTRYTRGLAGARLRVTTVARRWAPPDSAEVVAGFDQEAAAAVIARIAARRAEEGRVGDVARWLDELLVRFAARFGDFVPEDPESFRLQPGFSLFPQFMFHLRRSPFVEVFNSSPDETAFYRVMLNRERVVEALVMVQPTLMQYSAEGPPMPVLLDVAAVAADVVLVLDAFFCVVVHRGADVVQGGRLAAAAEADAVALAADRVPAPRLVVCDQYSSHARFLLAKLNPSATHKSVPREGSGTILLTDDISLQSFLEHLQELAVRS